MFTGIVRARVPVVEVRLAPGLTRFSIDLPDGLTEGLELGASVAVSGVCLTVAARDGCRVAFDAMEETLKLTTIGEIREGTLVNIERSMAFGDEICGHVVSGHVAGMADVVAVDRPENNHVVTFHAPSELMKYVFVKGFIALDGASLTVVSVDRDRCTFTVCFIPETLRITTFGLKGVGERVNVEVDPATRVMVETVERLLPEMLGRGGE
ncbi:MAG: riboflavin synthase subunit alpha [Myxococcota bacterium]